MVRGFVVLLSLQCCECSEPLPNCKSTWRAGEKDQHKLCYPEQGIGMCPDTIASSSVAVDHCADACGPDFIPFTLGVAARGVEKSFMNKLCLGDGLDERDHVVSWNDGLVGSCARRWANVKTLDEQLGDFVAKFEVISSKQAQFRQDVKSSIKDIQEEIARGFDTIVRRARRTAKLNKAKEVVRDSLRKLGPEDAAQHRILRAIEDMLKEGEKLAKSIEEMLPEIRSFNDDCLKLINIPMGKPQAHMMDICASESNYCMSEEEDSERHIGCCCAGVPTLVDSTFMRTPGKGMADDCAAKAYRPERRMEATADVNSVTDACRHATVSFVQDSISQMEEMQNAGQDTQDLNQLIQRHRELYDCPSLSEQGSGRRMSAASDPSVDSASPGPVRPLLQRLRRLVQRQLNSCLPPRGPVLDEWKDQDSTPLHVTEAQSESEDMFCEDMTLETMQEKCQAFCGEKAIPLLMGTPFIGFDHRDMDEICLKPNGKLITPTETERCLDLTTSMSHYKGVASSLVTSMTNVIVRMEQMKALTRATQMELNEWILSPEAEELYKRADHSEEGDELLLQAFRDRVDPLKKDDNENRRDVAKAVDDLENKLDTFKRELPQMLDKARLFMENCSGLAVGWDSHSNYLMDVCKVSGKKCLDEEDSSRAGCCCAYMPLQEFGQIVDQRNKPIPGLHQHNESNGGRRLQGSRQLQDGGRRLSSLDPICQSALLAIETTKEDTRLKLKNLEQESLMTEFEENVESRYPVCSIIVPYKENSITAPDQPASPPSAATPAPNARWQMSRASFAQAVGPPLMLLSAISLLHF